MTDRNSKSYEKTERFSAAEKGAIKERTRELKEEARINKDRAAGESALLEKINEMPEPDRAMAERLHSIIKSIAPNLIPKTWYGMPAYARGSKVVCFFQSANKFKTRYATLGFTDAANLDDGLVWPTSFALREITDENEKEIVSIIRKAVT